jgi:hypothetical protein
MYRLRVYIESLMGCLGVLMETIWKLRSVAPVSGWRKLNRLHKSIAKSIGVCLCQWLLCQYPDKRACFSMHFRERAHVKLKAVKSSRWKAGWCYQVNQVETNKGLNSHTSVFNRQAVPNNHFPTLSYAQVKRFQRVGLGVRQHLTENFQSKLDLM